MPEKMVPEVKAKWLAALRSGDFKQGQGSLHTIEPVVGERFCCLGVLCKLAADEGVIPAPIRSDFARKNWVVYDGAASLLPKSVSRWSGIADGFGAYGESGLATLANDNDAGMTFPEIADIIEREF